MRIAFSTFGCKINQFESDELKRSFLSAGNAIVSFDQPADLYVINTCTVTGKSDYQCRQAIRSAVKRGMGARVIVTGCYAQTNPGEILRIDGVTKIVGNASKQLLSEYVGPQPEIPVVPSPHGVLRGRTRPVIKIQDGCNANCSYCIIPKARGRSRSIPRDDVIAQFTSLVSSGVPEVVLSGIHIGMYGKDFTPSLSLGSLVADLVQRRNKTRIRLSSIEPQEVTEQIVELLGRGLCRHLHIPLQSGSDRILRKMNRTYTSDFYRKCVNRIAEWVPEVAIGTDVIVGFPGERDEDLQDTLTILEECEITHVHAFSYSPRAGTVAAAMKDNISGTEKRIRNESIRTLGLKKNYEFRKRFVGNKLSVVVEQALKMKDSSTYSGMSDNYIRVKVTGIREQHVGKEVEVLIDKVTEDETHGIVVTY